MPALLIDLTYFEDNVIMFMIGVRISSALPICTSDSRANVVRDNVAKKGVVVTPTNKDSKS